jgi:hypothetical protein
MRDAFLFLVLLTSLFAPGAGAEEYRITYPIGASVNGSNNSVNRLKTILGALKEPQDSWLWIILPEPEWTDAQKIYQLKDWNRGAFTILPRKTTYIRERLLLDSDDYALAEILAHEIAHRITLSEDKAEEIARARVKKFKIPKPLALAYMPTYFPYEVGLRLMDTVCLFTQAQRP